MSAVARAWLPAETPVPPSLDRALRALVDDWAGAWFARDRPAVAPLGPLAHPQHQSWSTPDDRLLLGIGKTSLTQVGLRILDLDTAPTERDKELLAEVAEEAVGDLRARLAHFAGVARAAAWRALAVLPDASGCRAATIGDSRLALTIALSAELFAALARAEMAPVAPPPLDKAGDALAAIPIALRAAVGRCTMQVADLGALAPGDVLVLDRQLIETIPLAIGDASLARGVCVVEPREVGPALKIVEPIN